MDEAYQILHQRVEGLTDAEFFWEPVPGCWTVHLVENSRWWVDYEDPAPQPPPFTTIGWRLDHVATCKVMYHDHAFGEAHLDWDSLEYPHTALDAITLLEEGHALLRTDLVKLNDADLNVMRRTNWGDLWPAWRIFWAMTSHDLHHGGEIGCLRDLYRDSHR